MLSLKNFPKLISKRITIYTFFYWLLTFLIEQSCLDLSGLPNRIFIYIVAKIILFFLIFAIFNFITELPKKGKYYSILLYSLPYIIFMLIKWAGEDIYPLVGDEAYTYNIVTHFTNTDIATCTFSFITYFTTYFYLVSMMLLPPLKGIAVVIVKIILCGLSVGYCIHRINNYYHTFWGILIYGVFFFSPSSELGVCIQRMPMYGMLYFFFVSKLFFDYKECVSFSKINILLYCLIIPTLTQWRIEGIYFLVIGPALVFIAYRLNKVLTKHQLLKLIISYLLIQLIFYIPQGYGSLSSAKSYTSNRMAHFYNYVLTNMMRYGLQDIADPEDLSDIDRYISLEAVNRLNADFGDECFKDEYITYTDGYSGLREEANLEDLYAYEAAMKRIIFHHPLLYLKVQLKAFKCVTTQYGISHFRSACTTLLFGNIILTVLIIGACWIWAILKKSYFFFWLSCGLLCHTLITTLLLPAAYFKYYYAQYVCAGFIVIVVFISQIKKHMMQTNQ